MRPRLSISFLAVGLIAAACSSPQQPQLAAVHSRFYGNINLRIGVRADLPGIGFYDSRTYEWSGLDIAVARYVMTQLHVPSADSHFDPVQPADRDHRLLNRGDDLIIAAYSITDGRIQEGISFTIPYLLSYQDILIRSADAGAIRSVASLRGRSVCAGSPSTTPYQHVLALNQSLHLGVKMVPGVGVLECLDKLIHKNADAVVSDAAILNGYLAQNPGLRLVGTKVWPRPEQWGIGFIAGTPADARELNAIIRKMFDDGSWKKAITSSFCPGIRPSEPPCRIARIFLDNAPPKT